VSAVFVTLVMFGMLVWQAVNTFQVSPAVHDAYVRGETFRDDLSRLHQEQMLSLAMMVGTGSSNWEHQHEELERELYGLIEAALQEKPDGFDLSALMRLKTANETLGHRAGRAIELARLGLVKEGLGMLSAPKFQRARRTFVREMNAFIKSYGEYLRQRLVLERRGRIFALSLAFFIFAVSVTVWVLMLRRMGRFQDERDRAIRGRLDAEAELKRLAQQLHSMGEHQCNVIAREVHDEMGQSLTALKIDLVRLRKGLESSRGDVREILANLLRETNGAIDSVQRLLSQLRPAILDHLGLAATIDWQATELQERTGIQCSVALGAKEPNLSREEQIALFRIVQESLTNVARHSDAKEVRVELSPGAEWDELTITDNGSGISESELRNPASYGLQGMRERARVFGGTLDIDSEPGKGTRVRVRIPAQRQGTAHLVEAIAQPSAA
jgi:signal transduction histidine kinase